MKRHTRAKKERIMKGKEKPLRSHQFFHSMGSRTASEDIREESGVSQGGGGGGAKILLKEEEKEKSMWGPSGRRVQHLGLIEEQGRKQKKKNKSPRRRSERNLKEMVPRAGILTRERT